MGPFATGDVVIMPFPLRVSRIFTAESGIVLYRIGVISVAKQREVRINIARLFQLGE